MSQLIMMELESEPTHAIFCPVATTVWNESYLANRNYLITTWIK